MRPEKTLMIIVVLSAIGVVLFSKFKTCQNVSTGALASRPWFWPCGGASQNVDVASSSSGGEETGY